MSISLVEYNANLILKSTKSIDLRNNYENFAVGFIALEKSAKKKPGLRLAISLAGPFLNRRLALRKR